MNEMTDTTAEATAAEKPGETDAPEPLRTAAQAAAAAAAGGGTGIDAMLNVGLDVQIVLGRAKMPIAQLLKLSRGSIIELDKAIGQPVEVVISDRLVARGDLVKLADDRLGVSLTEIVKDYVSDT
ncbi:FliM/FliN family flagellar motor switch protein [Marinovum sp.]|uniref:FliM/FliN family flagellar motor switch protein n=1 Tax=Marinovum sp. TaxID=2024839 RepID=UPI002B2780D2|nr:FliM/FliN family flagellar motor switch protein [Marinovum sp.]